MIKLKTKQQYLSSPKRANLSNKEKENRWKQYLATVQTKKPYKAALQTPKFLTFQNPQNNKPKKLIKIVKKTPQQTMNKEYFGLPTNFSIPNIFSQGHVTGGSRELFKSRSGGRDTWGWYFDGQTTVSPVSTDGDGNIGIQVDILPVMTGLTTQMAALVPIYGQCRLVGFQFAWTPICGQDTSGRYLGWFDYKSTISSSPLTYAQLLTRQGRSGKKLYETAAWRWFPQSSENESWLPSNTTVFANSVKDSFFFAAEGAATESPNTGFLAYQAVIEYTEKIL